MQPASFHDIHTRSLYDAELTCFCLIFRIQSAKKGSDNDRVSETSGAVYASYIERRGFDSQSSEDKIYILMLMTNFYFAIGVFMHCSCCKQCG